jgi:hypothetical protein
MEIAIAMEVGRRLSAAYLLLPTKAPDQASSKVHRHLPAVDVVYTQPSLPTNLATLSQSTDTATLSC